jgi:hypothetical protein
VVRFRAHLAVDKHVGGARMLQADRAAGETCLLLLAELVGGVETHSYTMRLVHVGVCCRRQQLRLEHFDRRRLLQLLSEHQSSHVIFGGLLLLILLFGTNSDVGGLGSGSC